MKKILPTLFVTILGCVFYLSSLYLYRQDIKRHDREIIVAAKEVRDHQIFNSIKMDKMLKLLKDIEEKLDAKAGVQK